VVDQKMLDPFGRLRQISDQSTTGSHMALWHTDLDSLQKWRET